MVVFVGRIRDPFERLSPLSDVSRDGSAEVVGRLAAADVDALVDGAGDWYGAGAYSRKPVKSVSGKLGLRARGFPI